MTVAFYNKRGECIFRCKLNELQYLPGPDSTLEATEYISFFNEEGEAINFKYDPS